MGAEAKPADNLTIVRALSRHENGDDVIDIYKVREGESSEYMDILLITYGRNLDLGFMAITGSDFVPLRAWPSKMKKEILH